MKSVGIDIGSSSIKIVEVASTNKGVQITQFIEHPLGQNPAHDPEVEILDFLRGLSSTYDQSIRIVFGLRQDRVSVRNKLFPFSDRQKILKSLPFELEEDLPFSSETAIYDAKMIRMLGGQAEVLACATPKTRVAEAIQKMADAGFDVSILSAEGIALSNCYERWNDAVPVLPAQEVDLDSPQQERRISIHVHIGHTKTLVGAYENSALIGVRSILWGAKNIADSIARRYEIPYIEALKEMQTKAFILTSREGASYDQIVFSDTISSQVRELSRELKISILEFKSELNGVVQSVHLTGGGSQILNLQAYLTQQLELPVNKSQVLDQFSTLAFEKTARIDSVIGVALGLAIEGLKKPRNPAINFLKGEFAKQNTAMKSFIDKWLPSIQVAGIAFVLFFAYSYLREDFSISLNDRSHEVLKDQAKTVAKLPIRQQTEGGVKSYIRNQKRRTADLKVLSNVAQINSAMDIMKKINDAAPARAMVNLQVKRLMIEGDLVRMQGTVPTQREVSVLQAALQNIAVGGKIDNLGASTASGTGVTFGYSFRVDRNTNASRNK